MSRLVLMCGLPGSGKSTWANGIMRIVTEDYVYISRDEIRFSLVAEGEEYFSQEDLVMDTFIKKIAAALKEDKTVIADATHLNSKSRNKVLYLLGFEKVKPDFIEVLYMKTPLETCLERNELRKGTRGYVPRSVIHRMATSLQEPEYIEGMIEYDHIIIKEPNHIIRVKEKQNEM